MNTIRRFDLYGQLILASVMLISIPFLLLYGFLLGLFFMGCWQLLSASLNTTTFTRSGYKKKIITYWKWTAVDLLLLLICFPSFEFFTTAYTEILMITCLVGSVIIAIYYLYIYHRLINQIEFKKELSGFLKS